MLVLSRFNLPTSDIVLLLELRKKHSFSPSASDVLRNLRRHLSFTLLGELIQAILIWQN